MLGLGGLPGLGGPSSGDGGDAEAGEGNNLDVPAGCNMGRRRSRAVLYQLSGHYKPEKGGVKTKLKLGNVSMSQAISIKCAVGRLLIRLTFCST